MLITAKNEEVDISLDDERAEVYFYWSMGDGIFDSLELSKDSTKKLYELLHSFKSIFD